MVPMRATSRWASARSRWARSASVARADVAGLLQVGAEAELHLAGGLLGEGDGDDAVEVGEAGAEDGDDAGDQHGGLAGAGGGLDEEGGAEVFADAAAGFGVVVGWGGRAGSGGRHRRAPESLTYMVRCSTHASPKLCLQSDRELKQRVSAPL